MTQMADLTGYKRPTVAVVIFNSDGEDVSNTITGIKQQKHVDFDEVGIAVIGKEGHPEAKLFDTVIRSLNYIGEFDVVWFLSWADVPHSHSLAHVQMFHMFYPGEELVIQSEDTWNYPDHYPAVGASIKRTGLSTNILPINEGSLADFVQIFGARRGWHMESHPSGIKVAAIISTYRRPNSLIALLADLNRQKIANFENFKAFVMNDGSRGYDDIPMIKSNFEIEYTFTPRLPSNQPQLYGLKNHAANEARNQGYDVLWFIDDDCRVDEYTLTGVMRLSEYLADKHPLFIAHYAYGEHRNEWYQCAWPFMPQKPGRPKLDLWTSFAGMVVRTEDFWAVEGIDERFDGYMGFADIELGIRLWRSGCCPIHTDWITHLMDDSESGGSLRNRFIGDHRNKKLFREILGEEADVYIYD